MAQEATPQKKILDGPLGAVLAVVFFLVLVTAAVSLVVFIVTMGTGITAVAHSEDPEAELAKRPVLRRVYNWWNAVEDSVSDTEKTYVMPDGNRVRKDGTIVGKEPPKQP